MRLRESIKKAGFVLNHIANECGMCRQTIYNLDKYPLTAKTKKSYKTVIRVLKKNKIKILKG